MTLLWLGVAWHWDVLVLLMIRLINGVTLSIGDESTRDNWIYIAVKEHLPKVYMAKVISARGKGSMMDLVARILVYAIVSSRQS
jgi:hypothetical protein